MDIVNIKEFNADIKNIMQEKTPKKKITKGHNRNLKKVFAKLCPVYGRK